MILLGGIFVFKKLMALNDKSVQILGGFLLSGPLYF